MPYTTAEIGLRLCGRREITYDPEKMADESIVETIKAVFPIHEQNRQEIDYLWRYYKGDTPIYGKTKTVREDLNEKVSVNHAYQIVSFNVGYLLGEPIQYVSRSDDPSVMEGIGKINSYMFEEDAGSVDVDVAEWFNVCGTAYKIILPDNENTEKDASPFEVYSLDPRYTFVVYSNDVSRRPLCAITYVTDGYKDNVKKTIYSVYTKDKFYKVIDDEIAEETENPCKEIPIIEYPANKARLGAFEIVISLLDSINLVESNRVDAIEQFVQAFMVFIGANIDHDKLLALKEEGALLLPENADVKYLVQELNQTQTQTLIDEMYQTVLTICGLPNRNGGTSTSDTGTAVVYRDGWEDAESRAKKTEMLYKKSEKRLLRVALTLCKVLSDININLSDIEIRFTRRNYENIQVKSQVLTTMLDNEKIDRKLAFEVCGLFADPDLAYQLSEEQYQKSLKEGQTNAGQTDPASDGGGLGGN